MRAGHVVLLLLLVAGIAWWWLGHPGYETREQKLARVEAAREAATPKLYRWRDANGVLQLTDQPPKGGRKYEVVEMRDDINVIPMSEPAAEPAK